MYFWRENWENVLKVSAVPIGYENGGLRAILDALEERENFSACWTLKLLFLVLQTFA